MKIIATNSFDIRINISSTNSVITNLVIHFFQNEVLPVRTDVVLIEKKQQKPCDSIKLAATFSHNREGKVKADLFLSDKKARDLVIYLVIKKLCNFDKKFLCFLHIRESTKSVFLYYFGVYIFDISNLINH